MKTFLELREKVSKGKMPPGEHAFDKKIKNVELMIHKEKNKFVVYVDRDKFDEFSNLNQAKRAGMEFIKAMTK